MIALALYQPDIPQNTGTLLRLGACFGVSVHIVHPTGFALTDGRMRRAGMDYISSVEATEHIDWNAFEDWRATTGPRLIAASSRGAELLPRMRFEPDDIILLGRESAGLPDDVLAGADASVRIPMRPGMRSLNLAVAGAIVVAEALRQTGQFP